jgi:hypothetical protein
VEGKTGLLIGDGEATMRTDRTLAQADLKHRSANGLWTELSVVVARLRRDLFATYHPERHYMRGPGPAWHAKHAGIASRQVAIDPGTFPEAAFAAPGLRRETEFLQELPLKLEVALQVAPEFRWA